MTYTLYIGDRTFSSWSLRGWLMLEKFGLPYQTRMVGLYSGTMAADLAHIAPARTVPAMTTPEGHVLTDSLAMAETLVERHPDVALYPRDPAARAVARSICAEMHSGFAALRSECPNMISHVWDGFQPSDAVLADLARIEELWALARARHGNDSPWLFGDYSLADVFYAPVALRITTYGLPVSPAAQAYVAAHLRDPAFLDWRQAALQEIHDPWPYPLDLPRKPWPVNLS
ncbi:MULTISPECIES: glutathione S-transferase [unclassified Yoonia]|uniref:glutathione S-transferase n=1 Tax=unclassified Yoonia TaxID=2629118 RepID=UPI002B001433|nr:MULTISPECIES: glutathione S-transferase [unclassified Yoonia]